MLDRTQNGLIVNDANGLNLTRREAEVFRLVSQGLANKVVANQLGLREGTVKAHLHSIYRKLRIPNRARLVLIAKQLDHLNCLR